MDEEKDKETKKQKRVPFWLEVTAVVIAIIGGINGIIQPYLPKGPTEVKLISDQSIVQSVSYSESTLQVSVDGFLLDGTQEYCITKGKNITIAWNASPPCRSITYQIGDRDPITVKNSQTAEFRFTSYWDKTEAVPLKVSAEGQNGERTEEQVYRVIVCSTDGVSQSALFVCANGSVMDTEHTYLLNQGQPVYVMRSGEQSYTELQYMVGTGEIVTVGFSGFYEIIPADSYADTGAFSLNVRAKQTDGTYTPWVRYVLKTTVERK